MFDIELGPQGQTKKERLNIVLKYQEHENFLLVESSVAEQLVRVYELKLRKEITALGLFFRLALSDSTCIPSLRNFWYIKCTAAQSEEFNILTVKFYRRRV